MQDNTETTKKKSFVEEVHPKSIFAVGDVVVFYRGYVVDENSATKTSINIVPKTITPKEKFYEFNDRQFIIVDRKERRLSHVWPRSCSDSKLWIYQYELVRADDPRFSIRKVFYNNIFKPEP